MYFVTKCHSEFHTSLTSSKARNLFLCIKISRFARNDINTSVKKVIFKHHKVAKDQWYSDQITIIHHEAMQKRPVSGQVLFRPVPVAGNLFRSLGLSTSSGGYLSCSGRCW